MKRRALAGLLLVLAVCAAFACGRKAKPEPLRAGASIRSTVSLSR